MDQEHNHVLTLKASECGTQTGCNFCAPTIFNESYDVDERALDAFSVQLDDQIVPAKTFLDDEKERHPPVEEGLSKSIDGLPAKVQRNDTVAPALRPDQLRPREQSSLFAFEHEEKNQPEVQRTTGESVEAVLNAADREISDLSDVNGQGTTIFIDHREGRSTLPGYLQGLGFQIRLTQLPCGDIRLSERVLIERKSARDLLDSVKSGRLLHQCRSLQASAHRPLLLVETGSEGNYSVHPNAVLGALAHITLDLGVPVMMVKGPLEAAHFLGVAVKREHDALQRLHNFVNAEPSIEVNVNAAVAVAKREIQSLAEQPDQQHPWLDNRHEHLERCFDHTVSPLANGDNDLLELFAAYSPDIGRLFSATSESIRATTGCSETLAARAIAALNTDITSR